MSITIESLVALLGSGFVLWWLSKLLNDKKETTENRVEINHLKESQNKIERRVSDIEKEIPKIDHLEDRLNRLKNED